MRVIDLQLTNSKLILSRLAPNYSDLAEHAHPDHYQVTIPIAGEIFVDLNKRPNHVKKMTRLITLPGDEHLHYNNEQECRILQLNIQKSFIEKVASSRLNLHNSPIELATYSEESSDKLIRIADEMVRNSVFYDESEALLEELEWKLAETLLTVQDGSHRAQWQKEVTYHQHPLIKNTIEYMYDNYQNNISLDELSRVSNISKYYFIRVFKEVTNCTPNQFLINIRLEIAVKYLLTTKLDITTICYKVGFGSLNNFERVFKKKYGCTISQYRKRNVI